MSRYRFALQLTVAFLGLSALLLPSAAAQEASPTPSSLILPPDTMVAGLDAGEWTARQWQWVASFPFSLNPMFDTTGERCGYGQSGPVFFLADSALASAVERTCTVSDDVVIYIPYGGASCSNFEAPPFFAKDDASMRACATGLTNTLDMSAVTMTIDGQPVGDLTAYRAVTPIFTLNLPVDNVYGLPAVVGQAVADSYQLMVGPLPAGEHQIVINHPGSDGTPVPLTYTLNVQDAEAVAADASPGATPAP